MNAPSEPNNRDRDLLGAYAQGDPDAVRAASHPEPSNPEWEAVRRRIHERLNPTVPAPSRSWRAALWAVCGVSLAGGVAAAVAWVAITFVGPKNDPRAPEFVET
ncbi:MAG: hypothetical protein L0241_18045, partial [Planctomycetia bacterium]|nr:hypothetical protein [Planctomycetia bacterium]